MFETILKPFGRDVPENHVILIDFPGEIKTKNSNVLL